MTVLNNGTCNHCWANCAKKKYFVMIYNDLILQVWTTITSYFLNIWYYFVPSGILHVRSSQTSWKTSHLIWKTRIISLWSFQKCCPPNFSTKIQSPTTLVKISRSTSLIKSDILNVFLLLFWWPIFCIWLEFDQGFETVPQKSTYFFFNCRLFSFKL